MRIEEAGALVVGGASGLGAATARLFATRGARITIADMNHEAGEAVAGEIDAPFVECDVRDEASVEAAVDRAVEVSGDCGLRIVVCCPGIGTRHKLASRDKGPHPLDAFRNVIETNLIGTFNVMRFAAFAMVRQEPVADGERGVIVTTASVAAFEGQVGQLAYAASKGAIVSMALTGARDVARDGVRVVTIAPGVFDTPLLARVPEQTRQSLGEQVPFPSRLGRPEEYAALAAAIAENVMLNGTAIRLDGALRMPPR